MIFRTSAVALCCSSASSRSRVSRPTIVSWPAETLGRRTFFGADGRFTVLRVRVLAGCPPALERRLITFPQASRQGIVSAQNSILESGWVWVQAHAIERSANVRFGSKADILSRGIEID